MKDIIFCALPYATLGQVQCAPAILKGVALENKFSASTIDFNIELLKLLNDDVDTYFKLQNYFINPGDAGLTQEELQLINTFFDRTVLFFKQNPSKFIGISVFSFYTHKAALILINLLRKENIQSQIVVGGRGLNAMPATTLKNEFGIRGRESLMTFGQLLLHRKAVEHVIIGDGEDAIVDLLESNSVESKTENISDMYLHAEPNYDDYEFDYYHFDNNQISMPITGSKGCVRDCDFCDVPRQFGRYRYRSGQDIANEMINVFSKYKNIYNFVFTDSLVNGGLKPFREFVEIIAKYNDEHPERPIKWAGQYICRPPEQIPGDLYPLMAKSGAQGINIGAESGSNHVLMSMKKKTTVEALYHELEQFRRNKITAAVMIFAGHWSEDFYNFTETVQMLINITPYVRSGILSVIYLGIPFAVYEGLPEDVRHQIVGITQGGNALWYMPNNVDNTYKDRIYRRLLLSEVCKQLNIPTRDDATSMEYILAVLTSQRDEIVEFNKTNSVPQFSPAKVAFDNFTKFITDQIKKQETELNFKIKVKSSTCNGEPNFTVAINEEQIFNASLNNGEHTIKFTYKGIQDVDLVNFTMSMSGKDPYDTKVDQHGAIIEDKSIELISIQINNFEILDDIDFVKSHTQCYNDTETLPFTLGFWQNSTMALSMQLPFNLWYNSVSTQNVKVVGPLKLFNRDYQDLKQKILENLALIDELSYG